MKNQTARMLFFTGDGKGQTATGRGTGRGLIAMADTVTEMRCIKHGFQHARQAQTGVEY